MTHLGHIIEAVQPEAVIGLADAVIEGVACHPSEVRGPGYLFVCMDEYLEYNRWQTWRTHLEALQKLELAGVIVPEKLEGLAVPQLIVSAPRKALGRAVRLFTGYPNRDLELIGVTGTNGKTTTSRLLSHLLSGLGVPCGSIGTLGVSLSGRFDHPGTYTTPLSTELFRHLSHFRDAGAKAVAMEVSSHALALDRVEGLSFDGAILTNVERDHLDFHGTQEAYAEAKRRLFSLVKPDGYSVFNRHSAYWESFAETACGQVISYGKAGTGADVELSNIDLQPGQSRFTVRHKTQAATFTTRLAGLFQVENTLAAIALASAFGHSLEAMVDVVADFPPVLGRMEQIPMPNGCMAIVDYAHNPDGLQHVLSTCRHLCRGKLHVVFGCGGDRDKGKRPLMGAIASRLADFCWVTSDNPRTEDPEAIVADILAGVDAEQAKVVALVDRAETIERAYEATGPDDVLLVAGKGHEDYQIIEHTKHFFSDQAILRKLGQTAQD